MFLKCYCLVVLLATQVCSYDVQVKLKQGKVIGTTAETLFDGRRYYVFYGVPYAQPPVGKLRFKDPKPPKKWKQPFDATVEYHGACAQAHIVHKHKVYGFEDCLNLNIFTPMLPREPNTKSLKSVLVYVHGYAFSSSLSHLYGSDFLIDNDIIFITVTHRIGVFGFLKVDDTDPDINMGLKDIVMALKWVRKNIKQFGGDKKKITVMGSDSGATFLSLLLMTEHEKLFSKMILQSGGIFSPSIFQGDYKLERNRLKNYLRNLGVEDVVNASTTDIIAASQKIYSSKEVINFQKPVVPFSPIIEKQSNKSLLTFSPDDFYKNLTKSEQTKPILVGFNSRESISEAIPFLHNSQYLNYFASYFKFMVPFSDGCVYNYTSYSYKEVATKIKSQYFNNSISEKSVNDFLQYTTDLKKYPVWKFIHEHLKVSKAEIFVYKFNHVGGFNAVRATSTAGSKIAIKGASNGDEICYILKCEPLYELYVKIYEDIRNRDRIFIKKITQWWANFVKTGNPTPNPQSDIVWKPITLKHNYLMLFGNVTKLVDTKTEKEMYAFWNDIYETIYSENHCKNKAHDEL